MRLVILLTKLETTLNSETLQVYCVQLLIYLICNCVIKLC